MALRIAGQPLRRQASSEDQGDPLETLPMPAAPSNDDEAVAVAAAAAILGNTQAQPPAQEEFEPRTTPNQRRFGGNWDPDTDDYVVGKGRPPEHGRIRPGEVRSKGRPKGSKNRATLLKEALDTPMPIMVGGRRKRVTAQALMYKQLSTKAAKGDLKAIELVEKIRDKLLGLENEGTRVQEPLSDAELAILRRRDVG